MMNANEKIAHAAECDRESVIAAIRAVANCDYCDVDGTGAVWIEGPMRGHWMSDDEIETLAPRIGLA